MKPKVGDLVTWLDYDDQVRSGHVTEDLSAQYLVMQDHGIETFVLKNERTLEIQETKNAE